MKPSEILKPGMIGVNLKGWIDPMGTLNTVAQGDTEAAHVWLVLPSGKIATTGAKAMVVYGEVDPDTYLKGKRCHLLETVDPLTDAQLAIIQTCHEAMMASGVGRLYGLWKLVYIDLLAWLSGGVTKTGLRPKQGRPTCPICSQAVAYPFWSAGVPIGKAQGKEDWTAVLPETILKEAKDTRYDIIQGYIPEERQKPCYKLTLVQDLPFQF